MDIIIKNHAIDQYRRKMFSALGEDEIKKILTTIVQRGSYVCKRPGNAFSMKYNGVSVVVIKENNRLVVITCLGNKKYSNWSQKNEVRPRYKKAAV